jgi:hypothetical protein
VSRSLRSFAEFDQLLDAALPYADAARLRYPEAPEYTEIHRQLGLLREWTRGGRRPSQDEKNRLDFGAIASRYVDAEDEGFARQLYALASYVIWWE